MLKKFIPLAAIFISSLATAADTTVNINDLFADPADVVFSGSKASTCNGTYYILPRSNANFREVFDLVLAAKLSSRSVKLYYTGCQADRAVISHVMLGN